MAEQLKPVHVGYNPLRISRTNPDGRGRRDQQQGQSDPQKKPKPNAKKLAPRNLEEEKQTLVDYSKLLSGQH